MDFFDEEIIPGSIHGWRLKVLTVAGYFFDRLTIDG